MNLSVISNKYGGSDDRWLGSRHGVDNAKTGTLKGSAFNGVVKSGTPVKLNAGFYEPISSGETPAGFVLGNHAVNGKDTVVAIVWHGRINVAFLPVEDFQIPAAPGAFVYVPKED